MKPLSLSDFTPQELQKWSDLHYKHGVTQAAIARRFGVGLDVVKRYLREERAEQVKAAAA